MNHPENMTVTESANWLSSGETPRVLDVRTTAEYNHEHIAGSVNVPLALVQEHADEIAAALEGETLLVCRTDGRARQAAVSLAGQLGPRAHVMTGGMQAWQQAGLPVEAGNGGPWAMERQVRTTAGSIVLASILASTRRRGLAWVAAGVGAGLVYSGVSDTCGMAAVLDRMPWNRHQAVTLAQVLADLAKEK